MTSCVHATEWHGTRAAIVSNTNLITEYAINCDTPNGRMISGKVILPSVFWKLKRKSLISRQDITPAVQSLSMSKRQVWFFRILSKAYPLTQRHYCKTIAPTINAQLLKHRQCYSVYSMNYMKHPKIAAFPLIQQTATCG